MNGLQMMFGFSFLFLLGQRSAEILTDQNIGRSSSQEKQSK